VKVCKVHTNSNVADPLTNPLPQPKHEAHMKSMDIRFYISDSSVHGRFYVMNMFME
jgi:hypothetical protein